MTEEEKWKELEEYYRGINLGFNNRPKSKDIDWLYDRLQEFHRTTREHLEKNPRLKERTLHSAKNKVISKKN